jgi:uncharacterized GH25 family protein
MRWLKTILFTAFLTLPLPGFAHELWIEPLDFQPGATVPIEAHLVNGQRFEGIELPYIPASTVELSLTLGDQTVAVAPRIGSKPALSAPALGDGLHIALYRSAQATVIYAEMEKFESFVAHKDLDPILETHRARGYPEANFSEVYTRYSKSLIGVGGAAGADRNFGMETELVALTNPYTDDLSAGFRVQLFYRGQTRNDAQVEVFDRAGDGTVTIYTLRTDGTGVATVPVTAGHAYMLDAVVLREPEGVSNPGALWESLWANLTFAVPE